MTEPAAPKDEHPGDPATTGHVRETRFAVVLNGGVSLAVWMGGVTHELNRLRLASDPGAGPDDPGEAAVHRAWSDILRETSGRTVIDTVAGTSAGGLNGSLLASAVAGGKDLPDMGTKWAEIASLDVGRLLRDPDRAGEDVADDCGSPQDGGPLRSLLDGRMFHREVNALFDDISASSPVTARQDCTLLVTATALESHPVPIRLEGDEQSAMVDSRRVYRFRRQTNGAAELRDDFTASRDCVARAARASASFPLAFEPVRETEELLRFRTRTADEPEGRWLIDGGVLDNAPFGPLMWPGCGARCVSRISVWTPRNSGRPSTAWATRSPLRTMPWCACSGRRIQQLTSTMPWRRWPRRTGSRPTASPGRRRWSERWRPWAVTSCCSRRNRPTSSRTDFLSFPGPSPPTRPTGPGASRGPTGAGDWPPQNACSAGGGGRWWPSARSPSCPTGRRSPRSRRSEPHSTK